MKRTVPFAILTLALAACGLISSPPIENPFGLEGQSSAFRLGPNPTAVGEAQVTATFGDLENLNLPVTPSGFTYTLEVSSASLSGCPNLPNPPTQIEVRMSARVTVSDNNNGNGPREASAGAQNVEFTLSLEENGYRVGNLRNANVSFSNLQTLLDILKTGGQNTATLNADITTTSQPDLAGCTLTLTWGGGQGVLRF
jgi:type 1 fimbria pilin